jgi:hypothetical protein
MRNTISIEFARNFFGLLKPETKAKLQNVINNPCQETWNEAYCIIINTKEISTLWQAVLKVDPNMQTRKSTDEKWSYIPTSETIVKAIKLATLKIDDKQFLN